jgi:hypothetical protein
MTHSGFLNANPEWTIKKPGTYRAKPAVIYRCFDELQV